MKLPLSACCNFLAHLAITTVCVVELCASHVSRPRVAIDAVALFKKANASVVVIHALDRSGKPIKQGSGFIVDLGSAIITNYHVIAGADAVKVKTSSGDTFRVTTAIRA